ncbi:MAG: sugar phosphate isomerase/epimerase [Clostridia bacterium]|nr:sugar phosphate isomerase/epimerase [Clostridia bacterium]
MKIGVCRGLDDFDAMNAAIQAGVDYWETGFSCLAEFDDEKINTCKETLKACGLTCIASNGFIPGNMKLVGDDVDYVALKEYIDRGFERAEKIGVKKVVLGSGKARSFPEGFSLEKAKEQLAFFLKEYAAPRAKKADCIIVIEPLRFCESTMIYTVADGVEIARMSKSDNVKGLADLYHVYGNCDSIEGIAQFKGEIRHAHIAQPDTRRYPSLFDGDDIKSIYKKFFASLRASGCDTCSIEARTDDFNGEISDAIKVLKSIDIY